MKTKETIATAFAGHDEIEVNVRSIKTLRLSRENLRVLRVRTSIRTAASGCVNNTGCLSHTVE
jgi:hypothetical protein